MDFTNVYVDIILSPIIIKNNVAECQLHKKYIHIICGNKIKASYYCGSNSFKKEYIKIYRQNFKEINRDKLSRVIIYDKHVERINEFAASNVDKIILYREWLCGDSILREYKICNTQNVWNIKKICFDVDPQHIRDSNMNRIIITKKCQTNVESFINKWTKLDKSFMEYIRQKITLQPIFELANVNYFNKLFGVNIICGPKEWITINRNIKKYKCRDYVEGTRCVINIKTGDIITDNKVMKISNIKHSKIFRVYIGVIKNNSDVYAHSRIFKNNIKLLTEKDRELLGELNIAAIMPRDITTAPDKPLSFVCGMRCYNYLPQKDITICFKLMKVPRFLVGIHPFKKTSYILLTKYDRGVSKYIPKGIKVPRGYFPFVVDNKYTYIYNTNDKAAANKIVRLKWNGDWKLVSAANYVYKYSIAARLFKLINKPFSITNTAKVYKKRIDITKYIDINNKILTDGIYLEGSQVTSIDHTYPHVHKVIRGPLHAAKIADKFDIILYYGNVETKWLRAAIKIIKPFGQVHILTRGINVNKLRSLTIYDRKKVENGYELISCVKIKN